MAISVRFPGNYRRNGGNCGFGLGLTFQRGIGRGQSLQSLQEFLFPKVQCLPAQFMFGFPFGKATTALSHIGFQLGNFGIQLRLAMIELSLPVAQIIGQLLGLSLKLFAC